MEKPIPTTAMTVHDAQPASSHKKSKPKTQFGVYQKQYGKTNPYEDRTKT